LWGLGYAVPVAPYVAALQGTSWQVIPGPPGPPEATRTAVHGGTILSDGNLLAVGASSIPDHSSRPFAAVLPHHPRPHRSLGRARSVPDRKVICGQSRAPADTVSSLHQQRGRSGDRANDLYKQGSRRKFPRLNRAPVELVKTRPSSAGWAKHDRCQCIARKDQIGKADGGCL